MVIGPGSLFTSILPNLAVPDIAEALRRSSAVKLYVCNVMVEPGETDGFSAYDHVEAILRHGDFKLDYVLLNSEHASEELIRQYQLAEMIQQYHWLQGLELDTDRFSYAELLARLDLSRLPELPEADRSRIQVLYRPDVDHRIPAQVVQEPLLHETVIRERNETLRVLRHEPLKLAGAIVRLLERHYTSANG
ncbi:MAG: hypothetical protein KatS3mg115_1860 [Candidatus Poribacteria bacterium]|nr:MAG: hypothetical protein KatS3mg115_1860 [Candidatus Poribacteria bacterium]